MAGFRLSDRFRQLLLNLFFIAETGPGFLFNENQISSRLGPLFYLSRKPVTASRNGFDVATFAQGLAQHINVLGEIALFDKTVGPELSHELVLFNHLAVVLNQQQQRVDGFGFERHRLAIVEQQTVRGVDAECAELVETLDLLAHKAI